MAQSSLSDYLAAERTFLAWVRTGLALAGFGFVIARFGLFLRATGLDRGTAGRAPFSSPWFGAALICSGAFALVWSAWHYLRLLDDLRRGETGLHRSAFAVALALVLAVVGIGLTINLLSVGPAAAQPAQETLMSSDNGIVTIPSHHPVDQTVQRLQEILAAKGVKVFAVIDHSGEAEKAGMQMRPCKLVIFGNPKAGTPLMLAAPLAALDLPLKILVWEKADGTSWLSYNESAWLERRHQVPDGLIGNISVVDALAAKAAE